MSEKFVNSAKNDNDHTKTSIPVENDMYGKEGIGIAFNKDLQTSTTNKKDCKIVNFCSGCLGCVGCATCGACCGGAGSSQEITVEEVIL